MLKIYNLQQYKAPTRCEKIGCWVIVQPTKLTEYELQELNVVNSVIFKKRSR